SALAVKNIQASLIFFARLFVAFALRANIFCTRSKKYSSKLDIFRSFVNTFAKIFYGCSQPTLFMIRI
ncbi:MAG: hypothetical protein IJB60_08815, partial [Bacteroidaceae bacterium]|nr:hypothetical protein [Bacteroidaceae bacterium]